MPDGVRADRRAGPGSPPLLHSHGMNFPGQRGRLAVNFSKRRSQGATERLLSRQRVRSTAFALCCVFANCDILGIEAHMAFQLTVAGFAEGAMIPKVHTCEGKDISPALQWSGAPANTKSFALIMDDPDAPGGTWNHWLLFDIPAGVQALAEGFKPGQVGVSGVNDFGRQGYGGPCPPQGHGPHRYFFKLFAVNTESLGLRAGARRADLDRALRNRILGQAQYSGRYERK